MPLWLIRAGKYGEHEPRFFADSACYLTWEAQRIVIFTRPRTTKVSRPCWPSCIPTRSPRRE